MLCEKVCAKREHMWQADRQRVDCCWLFSLSLSRGRAYLFFVFLAKQQKSKENTPCADNLRTLRSIERTNCSCWLDAARYRVPVQWLFHRLFFIAIPNVPQQPATDVYCLYLVWWAYSYYGLHKVFTFLSFLFFVASTSIHCTSCDVWCARMNYSHRHRVRM